MRLSERLSNWFFANPIARLLLAVLAVAEYGNHHLGRDLTRICELTEPHDFPSRIRGRRASPSHKLSTVGPSLLIDLWSACTIGRSIKERDEGANVGIIMNAIRD
jgi:hypothetical protein